MEYTSGRLDAVQPSRFMIYSWQNAMLEPAQILVLRVSPFGKLCSELMDAMQHLHEPD